MTNRWFSKEPSGVHSFTFSREMTREELTDLSKRMDETFAQMDQVFTSMNKVFAGLNK